MEQAGWPILRVAHPSPAFREGWEPQLLAHWDLALIPAPETPRPELSGILSG